MEKKEKDCSNILYKNIKFFQYEIKLWQMLIIVVILLFLFTLLDKSSTKKLSEFNNPIIKENVEIFMLKGGYFF